MEQLLGRINGTWDGDLRICVTCNWVDDATLYAQLKKYCKNTGPRDWGMITLVCKNEYDYLVILNHPNYQLSAEQRKKSIVFHMEPLMCTNIGWGVYADPKHYHEFLAVFDHSTAYNNLEWHLGKSYTQLLQSNILKDPSLDSTVSTVLSKKYSDPGHILRVNFVKHMDTSSNIAFHVYGGDLGYKNYRGALPSRVKDDGLFPYKYTFNAENHSIHNYTTEKLVDGIMAECLTFYWGNPTVNTVIDHNAYVKLPLDDPEKAQKIVEQAIAEDLWTQRIDAIRAAKIKILNHQQLLPRLNKFFLNGRTTLISK